MSFLRAVDIEPDTIVLLKVDLAGELKLLLIRFTITILLDRYRITQRSCGSLNNGRGRQFSRCFRLSCGEQSSPNDYGTNPDEYQTQHRCKKQRTSFVEETAGW